MAVGHQARGRRRGRDDEDRRVQEPIGSRGLQQVHRSASAADVVIAQHEIEAGASQLLHGFAGGVRCDNVSRSGHGQLQLQSRFKLRRGLDDQDGALRQEQRQAGTQLELPRAVPWHGQGLTMLAVARLSSIGTKARD